MEHQSTLQQMTDAVARALRHWRSPDTTEAAEAACATPTLRPPFTVAISRQAGTRGPDVAREVGERLGWPVYDRELVERIAREMGLRTRLVESVDERHRNWLQEWWQEFTSRPQLSQSEYAQHLIHVLFSLASHGECVIIGRGAAQVLPEATTLRVRLAGPRAARLAGLQERFDLSASEAARWVDQADERRARFVRDTFGMDPEDPAGYDLTLNSCRLGVRACADLIVAGVQRMKAARAEEKPAQAVACPA